MNDLTRVIRQAQRAGLLYVHGGKHPKLLDPKSGRSIAVATTPRCPHAFKHVVRDAKRFLGVTIDL